MKRTRTSEAVGRFGIGLMLAGTGVLIMATVFLPGLSNLGAVLLGIGLGLALSTLVDGS